MRDGGASFHQDYYNVLGLNKRKATQEDVYNAYRKMAIRWHPDKPDNRDRQGEAKSRFSEIAEAYSVLIDEKKREEYDQKGSYELPEVSAAPLAARSGFSHTTQYRGVGAYNAAQNLYKQVFGGVGLNEDGRAPEKGGPVVTEFKVGRGRSVLRQVV